MYRSCVSIFSGLCWREGRLVGSPVVVGSLFIVALIVCGGSMFGSCFVIQYLVYFLVLQSSC